MPKKVSYSVSMTNGHTDRQLRPLLLASTSGENAEDNNFDFTTFETGIVLNKRT